MLEMMLKRFLKPYGDLKVYQILYILHMMHLNNQSNKTIIIKNKVYQNESF